MLAHDRGAEISFGIDAHRRGLLCRAENACRRIFAVGETSEGMTVGVALRNHHEEFDHGYHHVVLEEAKSWGFSAKFSKHGQSSLSGKRVKK